MEIKYFFGFAVFLFALTSCGETEKPKPVNHNHEVHVDDVDTILFAVETVVPAVILPIVSQILDKCNSVEQSPFLVDSNYLQLLAADNFQNTSNLSSEEVKFLSSSLFDHQLTEWSENHISSFLEIDSIRTNDQFEEYENNIDIGMILHSEANTLHNIKFSDTSNLLLWTISYSTYEACPYASGSIVWGSFFVKDVLQNTALIGESSGGSDAPYWGGTEITSAIKNTSISMHKVEENGGDIDENTDEEIIEKSEEKFIIEIGPNGFITNSSK
ncbi:MAG: hypothetical protein JKY54_08580 [Flavobacteriales bacterium]|nr:hypothetical protein [Flavobacteriales bacterium]